MTEIEIQEDLGCSTESTDKSKKKAKRGIIYLSSIPTYMNVLQIREFFGEFGKVGRVYLQLAETDPKPGEKKTKKRKVAKKFTEGWIEFERKSVAKKVATLLNNTQVNNRKKSKHYDLMWNMKYLSNFKWTHLHERLAYEKAARRQKLRAEIQLAKKKTNFFTINLDQGKKKKQFVNKDIKSNNSSSTNKSTNVANDKMDEDDTNRSEFLESLFN